MGYIEQSNTKKIYAYLTQTGKEKIITGDTIDFQIKYFSLHDDDINYAISSKLSGTTYNTPKSGFIPDITGDDNICLPAISDATFLEKDYLIYNQPISVFGCTDSTALNYNRLATVDDGSCQYPLNQLTATVTEACDSITNDSVIINVTSPQGGSGGGYQWRVIPVDLNNVPIPTSNVDLYSVFNFADYLSYKPINQPVSFYTFISLINDYNIRYQVYLKDGNSTESLIYTSTLDCKTAPAVREDLNFSNTINSSSVGLVGGSSPINNVLPLEPSKYVELNIFMRNTTSTPISPSLLDAAYFKLQRFNVLGNSAWDYIDIVVYDETTQVETPITTNLILKFNNNDYGPTTNVGNLNTYYRKDIKLKIKRTSFKTSIPSNTSPILQNGQVFIQAYTDFGTTNSTASFTDNAVNQYNISVYVSP